MHKNQRRPAGEREVAKGVAGVLRDIVALQPSNPADYKAKLVLANTAVQSLGLLARALECVVCGPHCDFDYIEDSLEDVDTSARRVKESLNDR